MGRERKGIQGISGDTFVLTRAATGDDLEAAWRDQEVCIGLVDAPVTYLPYFVLLYRLSFLVLHIHFPGSS